MFKRSPLSDGFSIDDVVEWTEWQNHRSTRFRGRVTRVGKTITARADADGHEKTFRRRKYGDAFECRKVNVARERWLLDLEAWWEARPKTGLLALSPILRFEGATVSMPTTARTIRATLDTMEELADEAYSIREWLRKRPVEPEALE